MHRKKTENRPQPFRLTISVKCALVNGILSKSHCWNQIPKSQKRWTWQHKEHMWSLFFDKRFLSLSIGHRRWLFEVYLKWRDLGMRFEYCLGNFQMIFSQKKKKEIILCIPYKKILLLFFRYHTHQSLSLMPFSSSSCQFISYFDHLFPNLYHIYQNSFTITSPYQKSKLPN